MIAPTEIPARRANTLQVMKMAQAFSELGHQVYLYAPQSPANKNSVSETGRSWESLARHYGLHQPFSVEWLGARNAFRRYDFSWKAIQHAQNQGAQLIYTRLPQAAALASIQGVPTIFEIHDFPQGKMGPVLFRTFLKGQGAKRMVVITHALYKDLNQFFQIPQENFFTQVAPDGVDLERYLDLPAPIQAREQLFLSPLSILADRQAIPKSFITQFTAGYTGHLYPGRGTQLLIEMAAKLPQINFLVVGGEPQDVQLLQQKARMLNLSNLFLTGFIPNSELPGFQAACDVLLMPYQENVSASSGGNIARYLSPMKLFEYMACQRVILSSDLPVLQEILNQKNSILLPANDLQAWITTLARLQTDPETCKRLAWQARQDVTQYTWQARASRIIEGID